MTAPLTADVAQIIGALKDRQASWVGDGSSPDKLCHDAADMLTALATQLAERDAELARVKAELDTAQAGWDDQKERHKECFQASYKTLIRSLDAEHALIATNARIAALTEALRHYAGDPSSSGIVARAALTTDKEPTT